MELEDYQKRDAHIIRYCEQMITKYDKTIEKYCCSESRIKRSAYKDILFKLTKNNTEHGK